MSVRRFFCFLVLFAFAAQLCGCEKDKTTVDDTEIYEVYFFDVKDSDASLLRCGSYNILINGGDLADSRIIYTYLRNKGIDYIDLLICTYATELAAGSFSALLDYIKVGKIYAPNYTEKNQFFSELSSKADILGIEMREPYSGERINMGNCQVEFFVPSVNKNDVYNYASFITRVQIFDKAFLFTAGAEREEQNEVIEQGFDLKADILKTGCWFSEDKLSIDFLKCVLPKNIIFSVGDYPYNFKEIEKNTSYVNSIVYRTDENGDIIARYEDANIELYKKENSIRKEWKELFSEDKNDYDDLSGLIDATNKYLKKLHEKDMEVVSADEDGLSVGFLSDYAYVRCLLLSSNNKSRECTVVLKYREKRWTICGTYY